MKRRDRILTTIAHGIPDRVPIGFDAWQDTNRRIYAYYGAQGPLDLYEKTGIDRLSLWDWPACLPRYVGPPREGVEHIDPSFSFWGKVSERIYPLLVGLERYRWPRAEDFDFAQLAAGMEEAHQRDMVSITGHIGVGLQHHIQMRGYEQAMFDVMDDAFMEEYIGRLREFYLPYLEALMAAGRGRIDLVRSDEDIGGQNAMLINPATWRRWYKPLWTEAYAIVHRYGGRVWLHSCGYCRDVVEDFIEMGADVLDPIPPYVKNSDPLDMKRTYGDRLCLQGGVNHIDALVNGTPEIVRAEVELRMEQMKPGGGYICCPSQFLTDQMPLENIVAFFDAALAYGAY